LESKKNVSKASREEDALRIKEEKESDAILFEIITSPYFVEITDSISVYQLLSLNLFTIVFGIVFVSSSQFQPRGITPLFALLNAVYEKVNSMVEEEMVDTDKLTVDLIIESILRDSPIQIKKEVIDDLTAFMLHLLPMIKGALNSIIESDHPPSSILWTNLFISNPRLAGYCNVFHDRFVKSASGITVKRERGGSGISTNRPLRRKTTKLNRKRNSSRKKHPTIKHNTTKNKRNTRKKSRT
jgi:hypothetical protein